MIDFLLAWSSDPAIIENIKRKQPELSRMRPVTPTYTEIWQTCQAPAVAVLVYGHDVPPIPARSRISSIQDDHIAMLNGWVIPSIGKPPATSVLEASQHFSVSDVAYGEYLYFEMDRYANGRLLRNLLSPVQLYFYETEQLCLLSTRVSLVAEVLRYYNQLTLSRDFARWVANYSVGFTEQSLFSNVRFVPQGSKVTISQGRPHVERPSRNDILTDAHLQELYRLDRTAYWDRLFDILIGLTRVVEMTDLPIEFPLSGGKDSRLLLGLLVAGGHLDRIQLTYTNGPEVSPEVRSARLVAQCLGLPHEIRQGGLPNQNKQEITSRLPIHLLLSEGEISPIDLMWRNKPRAIFSLHGQEGGLRNIAGKREIETEKQLRQWFRVHLGNGDICGIFKDEVVEANIADIDAYIDRVLEEGIHPGQVPTLHRIQFRLARWVGRVWGVLNNLSFAPFIFVSDAIVCGTYNAGHRSRTLEEFHYEMLRRACPELVKIPFSCQTWDPELATLTGTDIEVTRPLQWPDDYPIFRQRGTASLLKDNFIAIKAYLMRSDGPIIPWLVNFYKLMDFKAEQLRSGHIAPLWQMIQLRLVEDIDDFGSLLEGGNYGLPDLD
jgi:hypothetical protein